MFIQNRRYMLETYKFTCKNASLQNNMKICLHPLNIRAILQVDGISYITHILALEAFPRIFLAYLYHHFLPHFLYINRQSTHFINFIISYPSNQSLSFDLTHFTNALKPKLVILSVTSFKKAYKYINLINLL